MENETLRDIVLGIGRGFQSYDPKNPFAGAGAAMEAVSLSQMAREERRKSREERLQDVESASAEASKRLQESFRLRKQERSDMRAEENAAEEEQRKRQAEIAKGVVHTIDGKSLMPSAGVQDYKKMWMDVLAGPGLRFGDAPPKSWSDSDLIGEAEAAIERVRSGKNRRTGPRDEFRMEYGIPFLEQR